MATCKRLVVPWILTCSLSACRATPDALPPDGPYVLVLGTAQDGGLPHIGCRCDRCERARRSHSAGRLVTSLLVADPRDGRRFLVDATPDLRWQVERARHHPRSRRDQGPRPALFDGIFLTHAHMGHYSGLLQLGPEAYSSKEIPTHVSERMAAFLRTNGPWSLLVENKNLDLQILTTGSWHDLGNHLSVLPITVPHRDEFSDTFAFMISGPVRSLLYLPDIDKWERWSEPIESWIERVDYALLDGSFFADGEIPGRSMKDIPHPFIQESLERFSKLAPEQRAKIHFTHLNHSNPACDPGSKERRAVEAAGMHVAEDGMIFEL